MALAACVYGVSGPNMPLHMLAVRRQFSPCTVGSALRKGAPQGPRGPTAVAGIQSPHHPQAHSQATAPTPSHTRAHTHWVRQLHTTSVGFRLCESPTSAVSAVAAVSGWAAPPPTVAHLTDSNYSDYYDAFDAFNASSGSYRCHSSSSSSSVVAGSLLLLRPAPRVCSVLSSVLTQKRHFSSTTAIMGAIKLDGTAIAKAIRERLGAEIVEKQKLNPRYKPCLKIIQGAPDSCYPIIMSVHP